MKQLFDNQIKPLSRALDETLGVKHIRVRFDESDDWFDYVPVRVNYQLPNGERRILPARQIQSYKALGVLPR